VEELESVVHEGRWLMMMTTMMTMMMLRSICPFFWLQEMHPLGDSSAHCFGTAGKQFMEL
jgi:hypothetical protein